MAKKQADRPLRGKTIEELASMVDVKPWYGAVPYLEAMRKMSSISEMYGEDRGTQIIAGFLANANTMRGETMRAIKAELTARLREEYSK